MTYKEKLLDPRWQKRRLEILQRDNFQCQSCLSKTKTLHVHHVDYEPNADPWDYPDNYLITLCHECHRDYEDSKKEFEESLIKIFRQFAWDSFNRQCIIHGLTDSPDLQRLFFLLRDIGGIKTLSILENAYDAQIPEYIEGPCPACGGNMLHIKKHDLFRCNICNYLASPKNETYGADKIH